MKKKIIVLLLVTFYTSLNLSLIAQTTSTKVFHNNILKTEKEIRNNLIATALTTLGKPYKWGGSNLKGFDCSGLVQYVYLKNGINLPRMSSALYKAGKKIDPIDARPGDLIFFYGNKKDVPAHVVIYLGKNQFLHAPSKGKKVSISSIEKETYWGKRYLGTCTYFE